MTLVLPEEVTEPTLSDIGDGRLDFIRRENRSQYQKPVQDRVELDMEQLTRQFPFSPGDTLEVDFSASYDLGGEAIFVVTTKEQGGIFSPSGQSNVLGTATTTATSGTVTFSNLDADARFLFAYVRNAQDYRVSDLVDQQIVMDVDQSKRTDTPSFVESGSGLEQQKNMEDKAGHSLRSLREAADAIHDVTVLYHDEIQTVEDHVELIAGLSYDGGSESRLTQSEWEAAPTVTEFSRLFPQGYRGTKPKFENADFMQGNFTVDDAGEYADLQDAIDAAVYPVTVRDETREMDVEYGTEAELQERKAEIDDLVNGGSLDVVERSVAELAEDTVGFNVASAVDTVFSKRYFWINQWSNRRFGYEMRVRSQEKGQGQVDEAIQQVQDTANEVGF